MRLKDGMTTHSPFSLMTPHCPALRRIQATARYPLAARAAGAGQREAQARPAARKTRPAFLNNLPKPPVKLLLAIIFPI